MKLGILADGHGNLEAFEVAMAVLRELDAERFVFLGDAVGYFPGHELVARLRELDIFCLRGNHEAMLLQGVYPDERDEIYRLGETRLGMPSDLLDYLVSWPERYEVEAPCGPILMLHGSPDDWVFGYVYPETDVEQFMIARGTTVFMANTHRPFVRRTDGATFVNVGSCGLPRDCGNLGAACLFDDDTGRAIIVRFDIEVQTKTALARCGPVSQTVLEVLNRRSEKTCFGDIYEV